MAFNPTSEQINAINASSGTLVSAAAGSGKTAVLAERVVRLLTCDNPISADRILVVTFMSAAAEEMRSRIDKLLNLQCVNQPNNKQFYEQKLKLKNAKICTIDSFCIELVRENFDILGIAPDFRVGEDSTLRKIKEISLAQVLNKEFEENSPEFIALLNALCSRFDEADLKDAIIEIYNYSQNLPFPLEWLNNIYNTIESNEFAAAIIKEAISEVLKTLNSAAEKLKKALVCAENDDELYSKIAPIIKSDLENINYLTGYAERFEWNELFAALSGVSYNRWPTFKKNDNPIRFAAKDLRDSAKSDVEAIKGLVYSDEAEIITDINDSLRLVKKLIGLTIDYTEVFSAACKNENFMTFSQAEHYALDLLCKKDGNELVLTENAADIIGRFDEVLVDEFQDINDMQDLLFRILSGDEKRLFAVGDVKQSIYGFRGSNPDNFLRKKNSYTPYAEACENDLKKIILGNNFRSREGICSYVNYLFSMVMNGDKSSIKYSDEELLHHTAEFPDNNDTETEIHFIDIEDNERSVTEYEAQDIADFINDYITNKKVSEQKGDDIYLRTPRYDDFAILLRGVRSKGPVFAKILEQNGIPVDFSAESAFDSIEVKILLSLLIIIANPTRDIELVSIMLSPLFNFTADMLAGYRINNKNTTFISAVSNAALNGDAAARSFIDKLNTFRTAAVTKGIGDLVDYLYEVTEFPNIVSALENGEARRNNLNALLTAAYEYQENQNGKNIINFVDYVKRLADEDYASASKGAENAVKIMTIHKSKGLQFPVCVLADTGKRFSGEDNKKNIITDIDFGVGFRYFDIEANQKRESLHYKIIKRKMLQNTFEEEMRMAYVAATRAKEKLLIVNSCKRLDDVICNAASVSAVFNSVKDFRLITENATSYFDWYLNSSVIHPDFKLSGITPRLISDTDCKINFKKISSKNLAQTIIELDIKDNIEPNLDISKKIKENISFVYPFNDVKSIETKSSVAVVAHKADETDYSFTLMPDFLSKSGLSPAKRGTATHRFMQFADFTKAEISVSEELERLYEWEFISESERDAVDISVVEKFFKNDIYKRIKNSIKTEREMRFITEMPAGSLDADLPSSVHNEPVIIQGSVDLIFEEADGIVILDFKTDRVCDENKLMEAYSEQLEIYGKACEKIFEKPIKELLIYSFSMDKTINV